MSVSAYDAAQNVLGRARALLALDTDTTPDDLRVELRRLALAMGVASYDTYLHWAVRRTSLQSASQVFKGKIAVPFANLLSMANESVAARQAGRADRPLTRARNALDRQLVRKTFQAPDDVADALKMAGATGGLDAVSRQMAPRPDRRCRGVGGVRAQCGLGGRARAVRGGVLVVDRDVVCRDGVAHRVLGPVARRIDVRGC